MNIRTFGFRSLVIGIMLALAACQTTGGPSPGAVTKLQAAGYEPSTVFSSISVTNMRVTGVYLCPEAKCGSLSIVAFGSILPSPSPLGITAEEQIRRRLVTDASLQKLLQSAASGPTGNSSVKATFVNFRQFSDVQRVGFSFSMTLKDESDLSLKILANATVVGDTASVVMSFSPKEAQARRGLALALN